MSQIEDCVKVYNAEPTLALFHADDSFVRGVRGPIGSGKSVGMCAEILSRAIRQPAVNGIRDSRWLIARNTYGELKTTTIRTWQEWVSDDACPIVYDTPIRGKLVQALDDGTTLVLEVLFVSFDKPKDVKKALSLEISGAWINEAREVPKSILDALTGRVGRYNQDAQGWSGIIMDTNPPGDKHWWYQCAEIETPRGWKFFAQPPALIKVDGGGYIPNPKAENVQNHKKLQYEYWLRQTPGKTEEWIKVYCLGQYGNVEEGKPVYPEYNDDVHTKEILEPYSNMPILLGFDFGLTPACIFGQITPRGKLIVFDELVATDMGLKQFLRDSVIPHISQNYSEFEFIAVGDPAGTGRAQGDDEITCFGELKKVGFNNTEPAPTNLFDLRRDAVASYLTKMSDGQPCFLMSKKCKELRRGFLGNYKFTLIQASGEERYKEIPLKNSSSHPHDALQYLALRASAGVETTTQKQERQQESNKRWNKIKVAGSL